MHNNDQNYEPSSIFYVGESETFEPYVDANSIIEDAQIQAYEQCGEVGETHLDWRYIPKENVDELQIKMQSVFDEWLSKVQSEIFTIKNVEVIDVKDYI